MNETKQKMNKTKKNDYPHNIRTALLPTWAPTLLILLLKASLLSASVDHFTLEVLIRGKAARA